MRRRRVRNASQLVIRRQRQCDLNVKIPSAIARSIVHIAGDGRLEHECYVGSRLDVDDSVRYTDALGAVVPQSAQALGPTAALPVNLIAVHGCLRNIL